MRCHSYNLGQPCPNPARPGSPHCVAHDPEPTTNSPEPTGLRVEVDDFSQPFSDDDPTAGGQQPTASSDGCYDPENWPCEGRGSCYFCDSHPLRCHARSKRSGQPCGFPARYEHAYCINHDPEYQEDHRQNSVTGGRNSAAVRQGLSVHHLNVWLGNRAGIQAALDTVVRLELLGRISPSRSRNVLRALAIAARNFDDPKHPRIAHEADGYGAFREIIDADLDLALDEARSHDTPPPRTSTPRRRSLAEIWAGIP